MSCLHFRHWTLLVLAAAWEVFYFLTPSSFRQCRVSLRQRRIFYFSFKAKLPLWVLFLQHSSIFPRARMVLPGHGGATASARCPAWARGHWCIQQSGTFVDNVARKQRSSDLTGSQHFFFFFFFKFSIPPCLTPSFRQGMGTEVQLFSM